MANFNWFTTELPANLVTGIVSIISNLLPGDDVGVLIDAGSICFTAHNLEFRYPNSRIILAGQDTTICCEIRYEIHTQLKRCSQ